MQLNFIDATTAPNQPPTPLEMAFDTEPLVVTSRWHFGRGGVGFEVRPCWSLMKATRRGQRCRDAKPPAVWSRMSGCCCCWNCHGKDAGVILSTARRRYFTLHVIYAPPPLMQRGGSMRRSKVGDNPPPPGVNLLRRVYFTDFSIFLIIAIRLDFWCYFYIVCMTDCAVSVL